MDEKVVIRCPRKLRDSSSAYWQNTTVRSPRLFFLQAEDFNEKTHEHHKASYGSCWERGVATPELSVSIPTLYGEALKVFPTKTYTCVIIVDVSCDNAANFSKSRHLRRKEAHWYRNGVQERSTKKF